MEDAFRLALMALFEANQALCRDDPQRGRAASTPCSRCRRCCPVVASDGRS